MFTTERVPALLKKVNLDIVEMKEETRKLANCIFEIAPLSYDLANEMSEAIADRLFIVHKPKRGDDGGVTYEPRPEIAAVEFVTDTSQFYIMELFASDDKAVPSSVHVSTCICQKLKVKRDKKAPLLRAEFTVTFEVDDPGVLWRAINQWHSSELTFITLIETLPPATLDFDSDDHAAERRE